jgi:hypothetical protein
MPSNAVIAPKELAVTVNQVNAGQLAQRQGIAVRETRSDVTHDYIALVGRYHFLRAA